MEFKLTFGENVEYKVNKSSQRIFVDGIPTEHWLYSYSKNAFSPLIERIYLYLHRDSKGYAILTDLNYTSIESESIDYFEFAMNCDNDYKEYIDFLHRLYN